MYKLDIAEVIKFGWHTFMKRPWFFVAVVLGVIVVSSVLSSITSQQSALAALLALAVIVIHLLIEMGLVHVALKAHDNPESVTYKDLWHPQPFWYYLGAKVLTAIIVVVGLILLIIPGIIAMLMLLFATYLVIDRNLGSIEALKESVRLTKGNRWRLLLLVLVIAAMNIVGAILLGVGLLVSIPVSMLSIAHAYRKLSGNTSTEVAA